MVPIFWAILYIAAISRVIWKCYAQIRNCVPASASITRGHFRSRDKDGGYIYTIRSAIAKNPCSVLTSCLLQNRRDRANFSGYIAKVGIFDLSCSCDFDLEPMTFIYELDPHTLEIQAKTYQMCKYELPTSFENYCRTDRQRTL